MKIAQEIIKNIPKQFLPLDCLLQYIYLYSIELHIFSFALKLRFYFSFYQSKIKFPLHNQYLRRMKKIIVICLSISLALCNLSGVAPLLGGNSLLGDGNAIINGQSNGILGNNNALIQSSGNLLGGNSNFLGLSNLNQIYGDQNQLLNSQGNFVAGSGNAFANSNGNINLGNSNTYLNSGSNFVAGGNNIIAGSDGNFVSGGGNSIINTPLPGYQQYPPSTIYPVRPPVVIDNCNLPAEGSARFKADNGQYLRLCTNCGGANPSAASVEGNCDANTLWKIIRVGDQISIQGKNGNYLSRCRNCWNWGAYADSAFVHLSNNCEPYSKWTPVKQSNGKWVFRSDNGNYLARCNGCASTKCGVSNLAFVHESNPKNAWAQWTLEY